MRFVNCILAFFLFQGVTLALDLTPATVFRQGNEGPPTPVVQVTDGPVKYTFVPPGNWLMNGGGNSLSFTAADHTQAWIKLILAPRPQDDNTKPATPDAQPEDKKAAMDDLQKWAAQFIPNGATNPEFVKMVESPFTVLTHPGTEFIFSFNFYGSREMISISVVDFNPSQRLVVLASSDKKDFDRIRPAAIAMMFSWQVARKQQ